MNIARNFLTGSMESRLERCIPHGSHTETRDCSSGVYDHLGWSQDRLEWDLGDDRLDMELVRQTETRQTSTGISLDLDEHGSIRHIEFERKRTAISIYGPWHNKELRGRHFEGDIDGISLLNLGRAASFLFDAAVLVVENQAGIMKRSQEKPESLPEPSALDYRVPN